MTSERDALDWLRMMERHSPLAATTRATIGRIADEMEATRSELAALRTPLRPSAPAAWRRPRRAAPGFQTARQDVSPPGRA